MLNKHMLKHKGQKTKILVVGYPKSGSNWLVMLIATALDANRFSLINMRMGTKSPYFVGFFHELPVQTPDEKVVVMVRDPRDIAVSAAAFWENIKNPTDALNKMHEPKPPFTKTWDAFAVECMERGAPIVRYERLLDDTEGELTRIMTALRLEVSKEDIARAVDECTFDRLSKSKNKGSQFHGPLLRKGVAGDWKKSLTKTGKANALEYFGDSMKMLGYE